jgi:hypothetical protein
LTNFELELSLYMKKTIEDKVKALQERAKEAKALEIPITLKSNVDFENSLTKVIKTKEQADLFMKVLRTIK